MLELDEGVNLRGSNNPAEDIWGPASSGGGPSLEKWTWEVPSALSPGHPPHLPLYLTAQSVS